MKAGLRAHGLWFQNYKRGRGLQQCWRPSTEVDAFYKSDHLPPVIAFTGLKESLTGHLGTQPGRSQEACRGPDGGSVCSPTYGGLGDLSRGAGPSDYSKALS